MARYLRDEQIENITINSELLSQMHNELLRLSKSIPELEAEVDSETNVHLVYTIRFDQKGYRVFTINDLLTYFIQAQDVERIIVQIETKDSLNTNRIVGSFLDLRLDKTQVSFLTTSSDNEAWMKDAFSSIRDILLKNSNNYSYARNAWVELLIQIFGVFIGFALSLWGAKTISPSLTIENSFLISFLLILLIFSNLWAQIGIRLKWILNYSFPVINVHRADKDRLHWLTQAIVGGIVVAAALYLLNEVFSFMGKILGSFIGVNA